MSINSDALTRALEPLVAAHGLDLEQLRLRRVGRATQIVVVVDADGGVDLDTIAAVSGSIAAELDDRADLATLDYSLEVTSPGIDRPLTLLRHWRRNMGRLVKVELVGSVLTGRIAAVDDEGVELEVGGKPRRVELGDVVTALVQVEFSRTESEPA